MIEKIKNIVNVDYPKSLILFLLLFDDHMSHHLALCAHELYQKSNDYKNFNIGFMFFFKIAKKRSFFHNRIAQTRIWAFCFRCTQKKRQQWSSLVLRLRLIPSVARQKYCWIHDLFHFFSLLFENQIKQWFCNCTLLFSVWHDFKLILSHWAIHL